MTSHTYKGKTTHLRLIIMITVSSFKETQKQFSLYKY